MTDNKLPKFKTYTIIMSRILLNRIIITLKAWECPKQFHYEVCSKIIATGLKYHCPIKN
jgi:hypothetical protein